MKPLTKEQADAFISFLQKQSGPKGRANLAELRHVAADSLRGFRDIRILGDHLPNADRPSAENDWLFYAHRLTAALFALYSTKFWGKNDRLDLPRFSKEEKRRSLAASIRILKQKTRQQSDDKQNSFDLRVSAILDTHRDDLIVPLRNMIQRIGTSNERIPVDFSRLLLDIYYWDADETGRSWARDYWQPYTAEKRDDTENESDN